ncbi:hypothetical protein OH779_04940 [Actinacidiphila glaucinigra]|uniref:hypothetical protein n=1 Tax=Actinacidiphila glaucinigra TaxID=235986 RepID=UPI003864899E
MYHPLTGRLAGQRAGDPEALVDRLCAGLLAHVGGCLGDDAAVLAIGRPPTPVPAAGRPRGRWSALGTAASRAGGAAELTGTARRSMASRGALGVSGL